MKNSSANDISAARDALIRAGARQREYQVYRQVRAIEPAPPKTVVAKPKRMVATAVVATQ
jgi:hypothetical protein